MSECEVVGSLLRMTVCCDDTRLRNCVQNFNPDSEIESVATTVPKLPDNPLGKSWSKPFLLKPPKNPKSLKCIHIPFHLLQMYSVNLIVPSRLWVVVDFGVILSSLAREK